MSWLIAPIFVRLIHWQFKECYHAARFEKDTRYYVIQLTKDLLGDWVLILSNGRIKSKLGQTRTLAFRNFSEALEHFFLLGQVRHKRKYQLKTIACENPLRVHLLAFLINSVNKEKIVVHKKIKSIHKQNPTAKTIANSAVNLDTNKPTQQLGFIF
jgi:hypothetical protein